MAYAATGDEAPAVDPTVPSTTGGPGQGKADPPAHGRTDPPGRGKADPPGQDKAQPLGFTGRDRALQAIGDALGRSNSTATRPAALTPKRY